MLSPFVWAKIKKNTDTRLRCHSKSCQLPIAFECLKMVLWSNILDLSWSAKKATAAVIRIPLITTNGIGCISSFHLPESQCQMSRTARASCQLGGRIRTDGHIAWKLVENEQQFSVITRGEAFPLLVCHMWKGHNLKWQQRIFLPLMVSYPTSKCQLSYIFISINYLKKYSYLRCNKKNMV